MSLNTEPANVDDAYTSLSNLLALVQTTVKNFQPTSGTGYASQETLSSGFGGVPAFLNADASSSTLSNLLSSLSSDYTDTPHSSMCDANTRTYTHVDADDNIGNVTHDRFNDDCNSATNGDGYDENYEHEKNYRDPHRSAVLALSCEAAYGRCASEFTELQAGSLQAEKEHEALDEYLDNQKKEEAKRLRDGRVQARRRKVEDEEREKKKEEEHTKQLEKDAARILAHHSNSNSSDLTLKVKENIQKIKKSEGRKRRVHIEGDNDDDRKYDEDSDGVRNSRGTHEKNSDDDVPCDSWTRTTPQLKRERQFRASSCSTLALPSSFLVPHPLSPSSRKKNKQATREKMQEYEKVHQVRLEIERRRKLHLQRLEQQQMPRVRNKNNTSAVQESSTSALRKMNTSDKSASRSLRVHARSGVKTASSMNRALKNKLCPEAKYALALTCRGRSSNRVGGKQTRKRKFSMLHTFGSEPIYLVRVGETVTPTYVGA